MMNRTADTEILPSEFNVSTVEIVKVKDVDTNSNIFMNSNINRYQNEVYGHQYGNISPVPESALAARLDPFKIKKGVTYYYRDLYAYFCCVKYNDGSSVAFDEDTGVMRGGYFTATDDGVACLSCHVDDSNFYNCSFFSEGDGHEYIVSPDGDKEFTMLKDAIEHATKYWNSRLIIHDGTYDLITEYGEEIEDSSASNPGLILRNNITVIFSGKSKVVCNYQGDTYNVRKFFSPFNSGVGGFTIIGLNLECSNTRYCVHDERGSSGDEYFNYYKDCRMKLDNRNNPDGYRAVIGGGLGKSGRISVVGCYFESVGTSDYPVVSWHNNAASNSQSFIVIEDCYIDGDNGFRFSWYGESELISNMQISGCSVGRPTEERAETSDGSSPIHNTSVLEWNNEIRTN
jgi:hypothetical protein